MAPSGTITTLAGTGQKGFSGEGGPATEARFFTPRAVDVDASGNLYVADTYNNRIRKIHKAGRPRRG
jgi:serine/threonine-protein kinase